MKSVLSDEVIKVSGARIPRGQCAQRAIIEVKQCWSVIGWVTKNLLSALYFERHVKAAFAVVSTYQSELGPRGA
jgi:hypothetical protein